eukprot:60137-Amphidinium_carterae.1
MDTAGSYSIGHYRSLLGCCRQFNFCIPLTFGIVPDYEPLQSPSLRNTSCLSQQHMRGVIGQNCNRLATLGDVLEVRGSGFSIATFERLSRCALQANTLHA